MPERNIFDRRRGREIDELAIRNAEFIRNIPNIRLLYPIITGFTPKGLPIVLYLFKNRKAAEKTLTICNNTPVSPSSHYKLGPELNKGDDYYSIQSEEVITLG